MYCVYVLVDTSSGRLFYVGKTNDQRGRLKEHIWRATKKWGDLPTSIRIRHILAMGGSVVLLPIASNLTRDEAKNIETRYICLYREWGYDITNCVNTEFFPDVVIHHTEETKRKIADARRGNTSRKGQPHTEEAKRAIGEGNSRAVKAFWDAIPLEERKKMLEKTNEKTRGRPLSDEHKRALKGKLKGRKLSDETRKLIAEKTREAMSRKDVYDRYMKARHPKDNENENVDG